MCIDNKPTSNIIIEIQIMRMKPRFGLIELHKQCVLMIDVIFREWDNADSNNHKKRESDELWDCFKTITRANHTVLQQ